MPLRTYLNKGLKVSLGTDVAGGYSTSILNVIRSCIETSKILSFLPNNKEKNLHSPAITLAEAFYLATVGGA